MEDETELRANVDLAREIMEDACPLEVERHVVLSQLVDSIDIAESYAPESWAVTLFGEGFRLNIGPVEAFTFFDGVARLLLHGHVSTPSCGEIRPIEYKSVPPPQSVFYASPEDLRAAAPALASAHREFIRLAAVNPKGVPRRARFAYKNSPGLTQYARTFVQARAER